MPVVTSFSLILSLALAVMIGPQMRVWSWGPAMLVLGIAVLTALPSLWRKGRAQGDFGLMALGLLTAAWFGWRASTSPVAEFGRTESLLLCVAVGAFVSVRAIRGHPVAERILIWGVALLLLASLVVMGIQMVNPDFTPVFRSRFTKLPTAFHAHYIETANFLVAVSMICAAAAWFGQHRLVTRIVFTVLACCGLAGMWITASRGGILAASAGLVVLAIVALMVGKRRNARWFAPVLISIPVLGMAVGAYLLMGLQDVQETRGQKGLETLFDNNARLYFLGIALSCIGLHPMTGGGSRSFSWECFRFVDGKSQGDIITHRPELIHNELVQAATDYGLIGAGLLVAMLAGLVLTMVLRILFEERPAAHDQRDAWRVGGVAALAGMFTQSCFGFVFHLIPGVFLLGICLGMISRKNEEPGLLQTKCNRVLLSLAGLACAWFLLPAGVQGARVTMALWPTYFSKQPLVSDEARLDALGEALAAWPLIEFYRERAEIHQKSAARQAGEPGYRDAAELAIGNYLEAERLHPFEPGFPINRANLLSQLKHDDDAERVYAHGIHLQGGMEPGFRGHFSLANHYLRKGLRSFDPDAPEAAHQALELAAEEIERSVSRMHWVIADMREPRVVIHESLGTAREATNDRDGALDCYNFAATLIGGNRAHYRAGVLVGKMAVEAWSKRRPAEALKLFIEARRRIGQAGEQLPQGVSPSDRVEYVDYLDRTIAFLKGAKVSPE